MLPRVPWLRRDIRGELRQKRPRCLGRPDLKMLPNPWIPPRFFVDADCRRGRFGGALPLYHRVGLGLTREELLRTLQELFRLREMSARWTDAGYALFYKHLM